MSDIEFLEEQLTRIAEYQNTRAAIELVALAKDAHLLDSLTLDDWRDFLGNLHGSIAPIVQAEKLIRRGV